MAHPLSTAARRGPAVSRLGPAFLPMVAFLLMIAAGGAHAQGAELADDEQLRSTRELANWIPSIWGGIAMTIRDVDATIETPVGIRTGGGVQPSRDFVCIGVSPERCFFPKDETRSLHAIAGAVGAELLGPDWEGFWGSPRPLLQTGLMIPANQRLAASVGFKVSDFDSLGAGEPRVRIELESQRTLAFHAGLGGAFELPFNLADYQRVWLKLSVNYFLDTVDIQGRVDQMVRQNLVDGKQVPVVRHESSDQSMTIHGVGPGIGIEAMVIEWGPMSVGFGADFLVAIPLSDAKKEFTLQAPGFGTPDTAPPNGGPIDFTYDADNPHYQAFATVRFYWTGKR